MTCVAIAPAPRSRQAPCRPGGRWLIQHLDLVALERPAQLRLEHHKLGAVVAHRLTEEFDRVLAAPLRLIERNGRVLDQPLGGEAAFTQSRNADTGGEEYLLRAHIHRL